jgi:sugar phosphate isomerase/epimerase
MIGWAHLAACHHIDTTDASKAPRGTDAEAMDVMKRWCGQIADVAEQDKSNIDIEPHVHLTTRPEFMEKMPAFVDSPYLRMKMDTGNTFNAGQDPVAFLQKFRSKIAHVHVKDVSELLAASLPGELTGIALSECAIGDGVHKDNIKKCFDSPGDIKYGGVISLECEGQDGPLIEKSLGFVRRPVDDLNSRMEAK